MDLSPVHREVLERIADAGDGYLIVTSDDPDRPFVDQLELMGCVWTQIAGNHCDPMVGLTTYGKRIIAEG